MFTASPQASSIVALPSAPRVAGVRRELFASDGWRLLTGPERSWQIELSGADRHPSEIWTEIERTVALLAKADRVRPLVIDMRGRPRLEPATRWAMAPLLTRYESAEVRVALISEVDLVQLARVHSLLGHHAPTRGRRCLSMAEALGWVRPVPPLLVPLSAA